MWSWPEHTTCVPGYTHVYECDAIVYNEGRRRRGGGVQRRGGGLI